MRPHLIHLTLACTLASGMAGCLPKTETKAVKTSDVPVTAAPVTVPGAPLAWEKNHPEKAAWSAHLRNEIRANLPRFGQPGDIANYCSGFAALDEAGRVEALATMAVAIARRESAYKPDTVFAEPPPLNVDSVGLFQLSYEDGFSWCVLDRAQDSLKDPLNNITCAVGEMARLVAKDGQIAAGSSGSNARGLAHYWSVIRDGSGHHKDEIKAATQGAPGCS